MNFEPQEQRPLRIGIFVMSFPRPSETFIVTKVLKLLDAGFDVQLFTFKESHEWDRFSVLDGRDDVRARVHLLPPVRPAHRVATRGLLEVLQAAAAHPEDFARYVVHHWRHRNELPASFAKSLYQRVRFVGHHLDILHAEFDSQAVQIADLVEFLDCRFLCSARGTFQHSTVAERMPGGSARLFRLVDGYHFISRFVAENTHRLGLPHDVPTWHIEPAIDLTLFQPRFREDRPPGAPLRLVSAGRLAWAKGYEFALDAVARVRAAGVAIEYTIYGEGPYEEALRFGISQLGLEDCVRLAGALPREEMVRAYQDADVMIHAALEEAFCNAVIEAQAMELPVVTSDAGGLPENVEDGVTGYVVPRRDASAMASRVVALAHDPGLRRRLGAAGRRRALERFDLDDQAEAFVTLYRELAAQPRRKAARSRAD